MSAATSTIVAGLGAAGLVGGSWLSSRKSKEEKDAYGAATTQANTEAQLAQSAIERQKMVNPAGQSAINYFQTLLSGDRGATMSLLAPSIQNMTASYNTGKRNLLSTLGPGGVRDKALASLDAGRNRDVSNLFTTTQPAAAEGLSNLFTGNQASSSNSGLYALTQMAQMGANRNSNMFSDMAAYGRQIGDILFPTGGRPKTTPQKTPRDAGVQDVFMPPDFGKVPRAPNTGF